MQKLNMQMNKDMRKMAEKIKKLKISHANLNTSFTTLRRDHNELVKCHHELVQDHNELKRRVIETFTYRNVLTVSESFEIWEVKELTAHYREINIANDHQIVIDVAYGNPGNIDRRPYFNRETDRLIDSFEVANRRIMMKKLCRELKDSEHVKVVYPDKKFVVDIGFEFLILDAIDEIKRDADSTASELTE